MVVTVICQHKVHAPRVRSRKAMHLILLYI